MPAREKDRWITIAAAASRLAIDSTNVGKRARRGAFGRTRIMVVRGVRRRCITEAGLQRWKKARRRNRTRSQ